MPRKSQAGGGDGASCLAVPVSMCAWDRVGTQAAADSHPQVSPAAGHTTLGMEGGSGKARLVGKHLG